MSDVIGAVQAATIEGSVSTASIQGYVSANAIITDAMLGGVIIDGSGVPYYDGEYTVVPQPYDAQVLPTMNKKMRDDVIVTAIPYYETTNPQGGYTAIIGG